MVPSLRRRTLLILALAVALAAPSAAHAFAPPANDDYASATVVPGVGGSVTSSITGASRAEGETVAHGATNEWLWSTWYAWTAVGSGKVRADLCGVDLASEPPVDTMLSVVLAS